LERALLDRNAGEPVAVEVRRGSETLVLDLALAKQQTAASAPQRVAPSNKPADAWSALGLRLTQEPSSTFRRRSTRYRGGMRVESVRPDSPAAQEGILPGDILVGMHRWETASEEDIRYIITKPNLAEMGKIKFYVLRGQNTLYGHLNVASRADSYTKPR
jgi:serine protease Do